MTVIDGDHGSAYFHPNNDEAHSAIRCQVELQRAAGGDAMIGRQIYPLMVDAGLHYVRVSPRVMYVDGSKPDLLESFTLRTFTAMIEGVRSQALEAKLTDAETFDAGIQALRRTAQTDGVFCYTFFKGVGRKP